MIVMDLPPGGPIVCHDVYNIEPSWSVFELCGRCNAPAGQPCRNLRTLRPSRNPLRNPHRGRKKAKRT